MLTATRSAEVRLAKWREVDLVARVWTIPASRMKAKREHRVPLSGRAAEVLGEAAGLRPSPAPHELVFTSVRRAGKYCRCGAEAASAPGSSRHAPGLDANVVQPAGHCTTRTAPPQRQSGLSGNRALSVPDLPSVIFLWSTELS